MTDNVNECVIEWIKGEKLATVTMPSRTRLNTKIRKLAESNQSIVYVENKDGSILAHIPSDWVKINPPRQLSASQKEEMAARMKAAREKRKETVS